ncbi:MAG: hypothetical protein KF845_06380 [Cyclobacteriaceae bacterium]|nr:hypothetical protein [Cyclobacteriaceae bacterium]
MKNILSTLFVILFAISVSAQETASKDNYEYFVVLYTIGENWDTTRQAHEQLYFKEHSLHLSELRRSEKISIGGRYSDKGMIIVKAKNEGEAKNLVAKDEAIQNKIFKAEIFPFKPFYNGCIE